MEKSILFLPDISGFTEFVEETEVNHSQHVIAELLEILIESNIAGMELAEIEGDALFFYSEESIPSQEILLAQITNMFTAFYSHLDLFRENRICPCNACAKAPDLKLKIIAHCGEVEHIVVNGKRKPFGRKVIEAHRLLKNTVKDDSYALLTKELAQEVDLSFYYFSKVFHFKEGENEYDGKNLEYIYSLIDPLKLNLKPVPTVKTFVPDKSPNLHLQRQMNRSAAKLLSLIMDFSIRPQWVKGVDRFIFDGNEVNRVGTQHLCVINGKNLSFTTIKKAVEPSQLVYGEHTTDASPFKQYYQIYIITPISDIDCKLEVEVYWTMKWSIFGRILEPLVKRKVRGNILESLELLDAI
ncbi:DUF2652 domain-containing protein [uncultured Croceitalea sp.]|uniref:DUF2652 domain-containing protein n=1 Tax=uncultured Croceitalea sp. TaxID=1798908 RepID=UPI003305EEA5